MEKYICPVCGFNNLDEYPDLSYEICPCCGVEYGFDDFDFKSLTFDTIRNKWLNEGAKWFNKKEKPKNWNLEEQLKNLELPEAKQMVLDLKSKYKEMHTNFLKNKRKK